MQASRRKREPPFQAASIILPAPKQRQPEKQNFAFQAALFVQGRALP
ncbi:hypothetical protein [Kingella oralis]|nr:hypothetical protein [Kingella oralis]